MNINFISLVIISISISFINPSVASTDQLTIEKNIINKRNGWFDDIKKNIINETPVNNSKTAQWDKLISNEYTKTSGERKALAERDKSQNENYLFNTYQDKIFGENKHPISLNKNIDYHNIRILYDSATRAYDNNKKRLRSIDFILKDHFQRGRPYQVIDDNGNYHDNYSKIKGSSYPSGHTWNGFKQASTLAIIFPEKGSETFARAIEYGESRVIVGAHFATDTLASRVGNYYLLAQLLSDDKITKSFVTSAKNTRSHISSLCQKEIKHCLAPSVHNIKSNLGDYERGSNQITSKIMPNDLPKESNYLLRLRFPYLNENQRQSILASTAYPSHSIAGWNIKKGNPNSYWGLINLPKAYNGPAYLYDDVIINQSTNDFDIANFGEFDEWKNNISGNGKLIKKGNGTLILSGENNFSSIDVTQGQLILTGKNSYTQKSTINSGSLLVKGQLNSPLEVNHGQLILGDGQINAPVSANNMAIITGNGHVRQLMVNRGATVSPGHSIGTIKIFDTVTFQPDSNYLVEINTKNKSDQITSQGVAILKGGTVQVSLENKQDRLTQKNINDMFNTQYTILSADKGIVGKFDHVKPNYLFIGATLDYSPKDVTLKLGRNHTTFASITVTENQKSVAHALDNLPTNHSLYQRILKNDSKRDAQTVFSTLTGQIYADVLSNQINHSRQIRETLLEQTRLSESLNKTKELNDNRGNVWTKILYDWDKTTHDGNANGYTSSTYGIFVGADQHLLNDKATLGLAAGFTQTTLSAQQSQSHSNNSHLAIYGGLLLDPIILRAGLGHSIHRIQTNRSVYNGSQLANNSANYYANTNQSFIEIAYPFNHKAVNIEPFTRFAYINATSNAFNEQRRETSLQGRKQHIDTALSTLGLRISNQWKLGQKSSIDLNGEASWQHQYGRLDRRIQLNFTDTTSSFISQSVPASRHGLAVKMGTNININESTKLTFDYNKLISKYYSDNNIDAKISIAF